jgi:hypothetical protein
MELWTAQYRYAGANRLDITVKGNDPIGKHFAPTWKMVMEHKNEHDDAKYIKAYHEKMLHSYKTRKNVWDELLKKEYIVLVCFCNSNAFCHRFLLADYLTQLGAHYHGEINLQKDIKLPF